MANTLIQGTVNDSGVFVGESSTITFDGIIDIARGREAMNSEDFGSTVADSRQAASNRSKAHMQISYFLVTEGATSARDKVKELEELYAQKIEDDWQIFLDFGGGESITYVGKLVASDGIFLGGTASVKYQGTLDMNVRTETFS